MNRMWIWFYLSCKRYLRRWSFLMILLLLPLGTFLIRGSQKEGAAEIRIAVCVKEEAEGTKEETLEQQLMKALVNRPDGEGLFRFYRCENEQQVKDEVASRRAECGYVISSGLQKHLDRKKFKRCIRVYSAPSTIAAELSSEVVFAEMIQLYDRILFEQYTAQKLGDATSDSSDSSEAQEELRQIYNKWKKNGSTFHFTYESIDWQGNTARQMPETAVFPVRGIVAVYLFIVGLYGAVIALSDERQHLFLAVPYGSRTGCRLAAMTAPVFLAGLSGLAALWTGNAGWRGGYELTVMAVYGAAIVIFSWAIGQICRREALVCCLIPFFLVGSLVFCPVFLDIGKYIPEFSSLEKFFLPGYYLRMFKV